jgi:hypothetical protein
MVREPRLFNGGDFDFPESGYEVKLKNNRMYFFLVVIYIEYLLLNFIHNQKK